MPRGSRITRALSVAFFAASLAAGGISLATEVESATAPEGPARQWQPGTHYDLLAVPQPTSVGRDKVEVIEIFWYGCSHCFALDPALESWKLSKPADIEFVRQLYPVLERALSWIFTHGSPPHGYLAYSRTSRHGLVNQGWKDSRDSVFHEDGREARAPIALCEVQGYAFAALCSGARLARELGHVELARECDQAIGALLKDLKRRGLLDETLVIWGGEFGRTPTVELPQAGANAGRVNGRDHNHYGFTVWMAGGGVKGGTVYGATDEFGFKAVEKPVHVHDLHATILRLMGFDHERLTYRYAGRDFRLTDVHGKVISELIA